MNDGQWETIKQVLNGRRLQPLPVAFLIDSPWLPGWFDVSTLDYYASEEVWFQANVKAIRSFPNTIFLPGFWAEYGMCTEPSAFGCKCVWRDDSLGHPQPIAETAAALHGMRMPDVATDGLLPFVIQRLRHKRQAIEAMGHRIRFAVSRGPLNIASFLLGATNFLLELKTDPTATHHLLGLVSDFISEWVDYQRHCFDTIEGILLLDDIIGFLSEEDLLHFAVPYIRQIYQRFDAPVNFLHNDTPGLLPARHLRDMSVGLYNFSSENDFEATRAAAGPEVTLLGNLPARDILANGTEETVGRAVARSLGGIAERSRLIYSCGGGMPQGVPTRNLRACIEAVQCFAPADAPERSVP